MNSMRRNLIIVLMLWVCAGINAQALTSYSCDFEDPQELQNWVLNSGPKGGTSVNKWYCGAAGSFGLNSHKGLYVSTAADTTISTYSGSTAGFIVSYRQVTLAAGTYTLQADWILQGTSSESVYVFWVPATQNTNSNWGDAVGLPAWVPTQKIQGQGSAWWQSGSMTFTTDGSAGKVVVLFFYSKGTPSYPGPAVDNIEIHQGPCAAPTNVRYDGNTVSLTWNGDASGTYDVLVFNNHTKTSTSYVGVQGTTCQLSSQTDEGMYYFYVRQSCDAETHSTWSFVNKFVWVKGARCIDYLDLTPDNSGAAKCFYTQPGDDSSTYPDFDAHMHDHSGQVDYGYLSALSRHTIHYVQGETDPHTGNRLKTIPDGEIASIRLNGFWDDLGSPISYPDDNASCVEYDYTAQAGVSDLLELKFACVLQNPDHTENQQPRFKLDILRGSTAIDACAQYDLKPGFGETRSWHVEGTGYERVDWCDWQTVTVSLRNYVGQTLKIRLSAYNCTLGGHFGYAYFTINCKGGDLQGIACGDYNVDHFQAPDGFNYRWYKASDPSTILSDSAILQIDKRDTALYLVDLISIGKPDCYYTLTANPNPRGPRAKIQPNVIKGNCENRVEFANNSAVMRINRQTGREYIDTTETITNLIWDFGDGSPVVDDVNQIVSHVYPENGGRFEMSAVASMSGDVCQDTFKYVLYLPNVHAPAFADSVSTCADSYRDSHGKIHFAEDGDFIDSICTYINQFGCSADSMRKVSFQKEFLHVDSALICENEAYRWYADNKDYRAPYALTETDTFEFELRDITMAGCDSITRLVLTVNPIVRSDLQEKVQNRDTLRICPESGAIEIPYRLKSGLVDSVIVTMSKGLDGKGKALRESFDMTEPVMLAVSDTLRPDIYTAYVEFQSEACPADAIPVVFETMYSPRIVQQKDGFIAVLNEKYNYGHYKFVQYQWYKNGLPIVGAMQSYIATTPQDLGSVFFVLLKREGEERFYRSCDFIYTGYTELDEIEAKSQIEVQKVLYEGQIYIIRDGKWYDMLGRPMEDDIQP